jgi:hypothetical protein
MANFYSLARTFDEAGSCGASTRRGRRCAARARSGAVAAKLRLRCGARPGVASQNSLRSLRSLRSNTCDESGHEARCARRLLGCAPRRPRSRPHRAPPASLLPPLLSVGRDSVCQQRRVREGRGAPVVRREAQGSWPRAKRESSSDSSQVFERSERSERSEFCDGATRPSIAGQSVRSAGRTSQAPRPARTRLCRVDLGARNGALISLGQSKAGGKA